MSREKEVRDALLDGILVFAVPANQLSFADARLQQQAV
jgi:hypothetical protein